MEGNFLFDKAGHRDFLGAVLGTGISREKVRGCGCVCIIYEIVGMIDMATNHTNTPNQRSSPPQKNTHQVGDILIQGERGAHVIVAPEVAEYICGSLAAVRSVPVKNTPIQLSELGVRPPVKKEVG